VTQLLRQSDSSVFKRYSQAKLVMMREALTRLERQANEHVMKESGTPLRTSRFLEHFWSILIDSG
jgi:hypothetical protein